MATADDKAKDTIREGADAVDDAILTVAEKASDVTKRTRGVAIDTIDDGRDVFERALACGKSVIRANPIASVVIAATIAYMCGRLRR